MTPGAGGLLWCVPRRHRVDPARSAAARRGQETRRVRAEIEAQFARLFERVERGERAAKSAAARRGWETRRRHEAERQALREQAAAYRRMVKRAETQAAARGWYGFGPAASTPTPEPAPPVETVEPAIVGPDWVDRGADYFMVTDIPKSEVSPETRLVIDAGALYKYDGPALSFAGPELRRELDAAAEAGALDKNGYWRLSPVFTVERYLDADRGAWSLVQVTLDPEWLSKVETVEKLQAQAGGETGTESGGATMAQP